MSSMMQNNLVDLMRKIETFQAGEIKAMDAFLEMDWRSAEEHYCTMLHLADGWLPMEDPSVLWVQAHYSECLMQLGRDAEASKIHDGILRAIIPPDTDDETDVIRELLHLRIAAVDKLRREKRNDEALKAIQHALFYSQKAFGEEDDYTKSLQKSHDKVVKQTFEEEQARFEREFPRLKAKRELEQQKVSDEAIARALLASGLDGTGNKSTATLPSGSPGIQVTGSTEPEGIRFMDDSDTGIEDEASPDPSMLSPTAPYITGFDSRKSRSTGDGGPGDQHKKATALPNRPVRPNISDAQLLIAPSDSDYQDTDLWFSKYLQRVHDLLGRFSPVKADARPKIAILDTGFNTQHPDVQKVYNPVDRQEKRIKGLWKPKDEKWLKTEDVDGHGTHCAMVANKVAPNADIYVLRVFEDRHHAITQAVEKWNVDIISMSFALDTEDHDSTLAINKKLREVAKRVLIFAAAANSGTIESRAYPARRREVFAIHAAHGRHQPYNRNPKLNHEVNIGTLGMFVSAPSKGTAVERLSGTSVACAVAAGIAALVLEFCRQKPLDGEAIIEEPSLLKTKEGMRQIFMQMNLKGSDIAGLKRGDLLFLQPWELMGLHRGGGKAETARKRIAIDIAAALNAAQAILEKENEEY